MEEKFIGFLKKNYWWFLRVVEIEWDYRVSLRDGEWGIEVKSYGWWV